MNKQEYLAKRAVLIAEAEAALNGGNIETYEAKEKEIQALDAKFEELAKAQANAAALQGRLNNLANAPVVEDKGVLDKTADQKSEVIQAASERGKALKANQSVHYSAGIIVPQNAVTLSSTGVLVPTREATMLEPTFNQVSSLIDRVRIINRMGGESFKQPYVTGYGEGDYTADGANYADADTTFGLADINKAKITAYSEEDEGVLKLPDIDYDAEIQKGITIALRKKITRQILLGAGTTNTLTGIFSANATAIDAATDKSIAAIDENTLDEIVYSYGGDEDVEDAAVLILSKADLKAFVQLRSAQGNRIHKVETNGNTGTIDGIPFIINSACKPISSAGTLAGEYTMAYGSLSGYGLSIFSDIDVQRSLDFKFKSGQIAHRGSIYVGGNVIRKNGFLRIKKA
ncbi:phage major capsid protein [Brevibacillus borstelensis]|uniref:phage major capsid protein n=1 Tax=Brevibacillus borstelensis TaxID=45462 RepID=UPI002E1BE04A|nr:phage major capsid protein [Brevibacillus borstelensis]MED1850343.1 phage major capsid protein [Brevibacillus borstelensis]